MISTLRGGRMAIAVTLCFIVISLSADAAQLKREVVPKPTYNTLPVGAKTDVIVFKLVEGIERPDIIDHNFDRSGKTWDQLNALISGSQVERLTPRFQNDPEILDNLRQQAMAKSSVDLADLTLYHQIELSDKSTPDQRIAIANSLNELDIVEIAYFAPSPELATINAEPDTPGWESGQFYLQPAPTGIDAYAGWQVPGGHGESVKVVDIEGNWIETHEDLHGGTDTWHIAGTRINDAGWWNHGTAVLGEIASDSNSFGMTGIAYNVDLGTVSIGSMSTAEALTTATNNTVEGDIILIELHAPGPHYNFQVRQDQLGYVAMEYFQENFDVILQASVLGRIVVEAGGNGAENFDDTDIYGLVFDSSFRFSGAVMVTASDGSHYPASFTNYGARLDVHAFGTWNVYTLGYGDLYGSGSNDHYTATFAGTSSASPIIVGACAVLQGLHKAAHGWTLDYTGMRSLLKDHSTPQAASPKPIGPLPDLAGSINAVLGVSFVADTTFGWTPLDVSFSASSSLSVDSWTWDFGDGDSAFVQNPFHTYTDRGLFDVSLQIDAGGDIRTTNRTAYIAALADSLRGDSVPVVPGETVEILIYATNTVGLQEVVIPIEFGGDIDLNPTGAIFSTTGYRSDTMNYKQLINYDPGGKRMTIKLANTGSSIDLPPGDGPIVKLFFELGTPPTLGQATDIVLDGYGSHLPSFATSATTYEPIIVAGNVSYPSCCIGIRGNIDGDPLESIDITDLIYLVSYMFQSGPEPPCLKEANVDGDIFETVDIADLVYLVAYMFSGGPAPAVCF